MAGKAGGCRKQSKGAKCKGSGQRLQIVAEWLDDDNACSSLLSANFYSRLCLCKLVLSTETVVFFASKCWNI